MNSSDKILPPYNIDTFFKKRLGFEMRKKERIVAVRNTLKIRSDFGQYKGMHYLFFQYGR